MVPGHHISMVLDDTQHMFTFPETHRTTGNRPRSQKERIIIQTMDFSWSDVWFSMSECCRISPQIIGKLPNFSGGSNLMQMYDQSYLKDFLLTMLCFGLVM